MGNKNIFIGRIVRSGVVVVLLFSLLGKMEGMQSKLMVIPFLTCGLILIAKDAFLLTKKPKLAIFCSKLFTVVFFLFWFGFLSYWCYAGIRQGSYSVLLFSIPFWVISVLVIKKRLRKKEYDSEVQNPWESRVNIPIIIAVFLVGSVLISGIIILYIGIRDTFRAEWLSRNYTAVTGYFEDYNIYDSDEEGVTYRLIYTYQVNGKEYQVSADYGVGYLPEYGSERKVLYNPENHGEAVLAGTNSNKGMIFLEYFLSWGQPCLF